MPANAKDLAGRPRGHCRSSWLGAIVLAFLVTATTTSFTASVRVSVGARTRIARIAFPPWTVRLPGASPGELEDAGLYPEGDWCTRTTTQGSTPWGGWSAELITCVRVPLRRGSSVAKRGSVDNDRKECSP
jgi:hypothetical protein